MAPAPKAATWKQQADLHGTLDEGSHVPFRPDLNGNHRGVNHREHHQRHRRGQRIR